MSTVVNIDKVLGLVTHQVLIGDAENDITKTYNLKSIIVYNECNRIPTATLVFIDGDSAKEKYEASNADDLIPGTKIHIKSGYEFNDQTIFKGLITKHTINADKDTSYLVIECKDEAFKMTLGKKNTIFYDQTESDIITTIIEENSLVADVESTTFAHHELVQYYATDWDFIQSRIQINNKICIVENGKVTVSTVDIEQEPVHEVKYGDNIFDFKAEIDTRTQYSSSQASSWNYSNQEIVTKKAENDNLNNTGSLSTTTLASASGNPMISLTHSGKIHDEILKSWAESGNSYQQLAKICGVVTTYGNHYTTPGKILKLSGMSNRFNGKVFIRGIHHKISNGAWMTTISFGFSPQWFAETYNISQIPAAGMLPAINGLQIGIVNAIEGDPDEEHRIQIKLPLINKEEQGVWARVLSSYAGENYGMHFLPEIGNEVLVGFLNDDPNQAIVLGALFSNTNTSPISHSDDNYEKVIITKSEVKIAFDDEKRSVQLTTPDGKLVHLNDDKGTISIEDENDNTILMDTNGITITSGKDITLDASGDINIKGVNTEIKADSSCKIEAGTTAELKGSASVKVQGGMVEIN